MSFLLARWKAPSNVVAGVTLRKQGSSQVPYDENNVALHVGDNKKNVIANREALDQALFQEQQKKEWQWLEQVHGVDVVEAPTDEVSVADACFTQRALTVCTVMTADCLPVLICNTKGTEVAAIHAGWRSLCSGIIEETIASMKTSPEQLLVWFGPAIGQDAFEVGEDVFESFASAACGEQSRSAFKEGKQPGKFQCDIYQLARIRLNNLGINNIIQENFCTARDKEDFYSYRREGVTGRMASFIYFT